MSLLPQIDAARLGVKLAIVGAVALVVVALAWRCSVLEGQRDAADREVARLRGEMDRADRAVQQAGQVNHAMRDTILRLNAENETNRAKATRLEADARAARKRLISGQLAARQADTARRARLDKPSAAEMSAVLRSIVGAM